MMTELKLFAPASIANLNCGFDVIGVCLQAIGDEMIFRKVTDYRDWETDRKSTRLNSSH